MEDRIGMFYTMKVAMCIIGLKGAHLTLVRAGKESIRDMHGLNCVIIFV